MKTKSLFNLGGAKKVFLFVFFVEKNVQANREYAIKYKSMYNVYIFVGVGVLGQKKERSEK